MEPEQLILMLFKGALERIRLTREGIEENNIQKRGENLSKTIAIISELNSSLDTTMNDESTQFLRGLYSAILAELPKVSLTNDKKILMRTHKYISKLKEIWENDVMGKKSPTLKAVPRKMAPNQPSSGDLRPPQRLRNLPMHPGPRCHHARHMRIGIVEPQRRAIAVRGHRPGLAQDQISGRHIPFPGLAQGQHRVIAPLGHQRRAIGQ